MYSFHFRGSRARILWCACIALVLVLFISCCDFVRSDLLPSMLLRENTTEMVRKIGEVDGQFIIFVKMIWTWQQKKALDKLQQMCK